MTTRKLLSGLEAQARSEYPDDPTVGVWVARNAVAVERESLKDTESRIRRIHVIRAKRKEASESIKIKQP